MKINFTKDHYAKLKELAFEMLMKNGVIVTNVGSPLNVCDLLHTTTINTLNNIRLALAKKIETLENKDEWVANEASQVELDSLKSHKELVNLIIGYKRYTMELNETRAKKKEIETKLRDLRESQKTPEDKIKELEDQLKDLNEVQDF